MLFKGLNKTLLSFEEEKGKSQQQYGSLVTKEVSHIACDNADLLVGRRLENY